MTTPNSAAAQRQAYVKVDGLSGFWATKTGGNSSTDVSKAWDGGSLTPDLLPGPTDVENVVVSRPFKPARDMPLLRTLRRRVGRMQTTISVTPTDRDLVAVDRPTTYPNALLIGVNEPEVDAASGDAARIELTFATTEVR